MTFSPRSALFLVPAAFSASVFAQGNAQVNTDPRTIGGTYAVSILQNCETALEPGPGQSPFRVVIGANGLPQVLSNVPPTQPGQPPALAIQSIAVHQTLVINPRTGTLSSGDVRVSSLDLDRPGGQSLILQRTDRSVQASFTLDTSNNTLLMGPRTEQGIGADGSTITVTHAPGQRLATTDFGQTIYGAGDEPEMSESVSSGPSGTHYRATVCARMVTGHRISIKY